MKYFNVRLDESVLTRQTRDILDKLRDERSLIVKGGLARLALLETLVRQGKKINPERLSIERKIEDLDLILTYTDTLPKSKDYLIGRAEEIQKTLKGLVLPLMGRDIEPAKAKQGRIDGETIERILDTRDLTINEVILVPLAGEWWLYYTQRCWRDSICGVGMLNANDSKTIRRDPSRIVPSNRGFYRLFKFWVEGKVEMIWLPDWQIAVHLAEMLKRQEKRDLPLGANLGRYALVIANKYKDADIKIKSRWMTVLRKFGFTDLGDWDTWVQEQSIMDQIRYGDDFEFESDLSFAEIIDRMIKERTQREEARRQRRIERDHCQHVFETIVCQDCNLDTQCEIQKCQKCTQYTVTIPELAELPCNDVFITGRWSADEYSLKKFPDRF
ncbi:MAG: hypothetical protein V1841_01225 [Patescibacteria group bacterium]